MHCNKLNKLGCIKISSESKLPCTKENNLMLHKVAPYAVFKLVTNSIWVWMLPSKAAVYVGSSPTVDNLQSKILKWELLHTFIFTYTQAFLNDFSFYYIILLHLLEDAGLCESQCWSPSSNSNCPRLQKEEQQPNRTGFDLQPGLY